MAQGLAKVHTHRHALSLWFTLNQSSTHLPFPCQAHPASTCAASRSSRRTPWLRQADVTVVRHGARKLEPLDTLGHLHCVCTCTHTHTHPPTHTHTYTHTTPLLPHNRPPKAVDIVRTETVGSISIHKTQRRWGKRAKPGEVSSRSRSTSGRSTNKVH
jgi:hypothetical protein